MIFNNRWNLCPTSVVSRLSDPSFHRLVPVFITTTKLWRAYREFGMVEESPIVRSKPQASSRIVTLNSFAQRTGLWLSLTRKESLRAVCKCKMFQQKTLMTSLMQSAMTFLFAFNSFLTEFAFETETYRIDLRSFSAS